MALLAERNMLLRRAINIKLLRSCLLVFLHQAPTELFTRISTSSSYGAVYSYLDAVNVSAPKEQNVYSFRAVLHGAPGGAQCAFAQRYKHQAPTELFTRISTSSSYGAVYSYLNAVNVSAPKEQNVYSFRAVLHGAPGGAQCAFAQSYKHQAPTELFTRISTLLTDRPWLRDARGRSTR